MRETPRQPEDHRSRSIPILRDFLGQLKRLFLPEPRSLEWSGKSCWERKLAREGVSPEGFRVAFVETSTCLCAHNTIGCLTYLFLPASFVLLSSAHSHLDLCFAAVKLEDMGKTPEKATQMGKDIFEKNPVREAPAPPLSVRADLPVVSAPSCVHRPLDDTPHHGTRAKKPLFSTNLELSFSRGITGASPLAGLDMLARTRYPTCVATPKSPQKRKQGAKGRYMRIHGAADVPSCLSILRDAISPWRVPRKEGLRFASRHFYSTQCLRQATQFRLRCTL